MFVFKLQNEEKYFISNKTFEVSSSAQLAPQPGESADKEDLSSTNALVATISKVDIVIVPVEKKSPKSDHLVEDKKNSTSSIPTEGESEIAINGPQFKEEKLQQSISKPHPKMENVNIQKTVDATDYGDDTMKLSQLVSEAQTSDQVIIFG